MKNDYKHWYKPVVVEARLAHRLKYVKLLKDRSILFSHPVLQKKGVEKVRIFPDSQFLGVVRATFDSLDKPLSHLANSPIARGELTLRQLFDAERVVFEQKVFDAQEKSSYLFDYGFYVYDGVFERIALISPQFWHRLALATSNAKLITDPQGKMSWAQIQAIFQNTVVGIAGASVGGNILEGVCREIIPDRVKIADLDSWEMTNANRAVGLNIFNLVQPESKKLSDGNIYEVLSNNKCHTVAHNIYQINPYMNIEVYDEGLHKENLDSFLEGLDIFIEEVDDIESKINHLKECKKRGITAIMLTDLGNCCILQLWDWRRNKSAPILRDGKDHELNKLLSRINESREDRFQMIYKLCGREFYTADTNFGMWIRGEGEQIGASIPQSGSTAMIAGGFGGKIIALYQLGHKIPPYMIYDYQSHKIYIG